MAWRKVSYRERFAVRNWPFLIKLYYCVFKRVFQGFKAVGRLIVFAIIEVFIRSFPLQNFKPFGLGHVPLL